MFRMKNFKNELAVTFPSFAWMLVFFLLPSLFIYAYAFKPANLYGGVGEGWTLETVRKLANINYLSLLLRTLWLSILTTAACLCIAVPVSYHMATITTKWRNLLMVLIVVPFWSSLLIRIFAWKTLLHPEGIFHDLLVALHLISPSTQLLYNAFAVTFVMVYAFLPFAILPVYASATKFDMHLIEAALDLGATRSQAIFKVFLPGIEKGIAAAALMVFIPALGTYVIPDLVGGVSSDMLGNKIAVKTLVERNIPQASALSLLLAVVVFLILLFVRLYTGPHRKVRIYDEVRNRE